MVKIKQVTKSYFVTDNDEKIYFKKPLDEVLSVEEMQEFMDGKEKEIRRLLELGKNNKSWTSI